MMMEQLPLYLSIAPASIVVGCILDRILGDPRWLPHPVVGIGFLITLSERMLRKIMHNSLRTAGVLLVIVVCLVVIVLVAASLCLAWLLSPYVAFAVCSIMSWQALSARSLQIETMKVHERILANDLSGARHAVSMIVGRDTAQLSMEEITKASVETVAENTSDGVIAPLFYLALGGPVLGMLYKAINTMDSMVGYKNDQYLEFGCAAAKTDDIANFVPARLSALAMVAASFVLGYDTKNAWKIFKRDRFKHASPNSAQSESVCAGALRIALAGDAMYFGVLYEKPAIGDALTTVSEKDIVSSIRLMYAAAALFLPLAVILSFSVSLLVGGLLVGTGGRLLWTT